MATEPSGMNTNASLFLDGRPRIVLGEWIPVGAHFVYDLQKRFGCRLTSLTSDSRTGQSAQAAASRSEFFITNHIDTEPNAALVAAGDAEVILRVLEYEHMEYVRLEAVIEIQETVAEWQEENIGIEISHDGRFSYGIELDGKYSVDATARIVADLVEDTSRVMETILNAYQIRLLDVVFCHESRHRDKFIILIAGSLVREDGTPCSLNDVLGDAFCRAKLRQVIGWLNDEYSVQLGPSSYLVLGEQGMLLISDDDSQIRDILQGYSMMHNMTLLLSNVFSRIAWSWDCLNEQQRRIESGEAGNILDLQIRLSELTEQQGLLLTVPEQIRRDERHVREWVEMTGVRARAEQLGIMAFAYMERLFGNLAERTYHAQASIEALGHGIENTRALASSLSEKETAGINRAMNILTVVSVIVLPLTLITGIYGMNFWAYAPPGEKVSPLNMPELYWKYGYLLTLGFMGMIAMALLFVFYRLGLLGGNRKNGRRQDY